MTGGNSAQREKIKQVNGPGNYRELRETGPSAGIIMSLPSSMADFVPCDRLLQKDYYRLPHWKKTVPYAPGNFRKFAPEFLVE